MLILAAALAGGGGSPATGIALAALEAAAAFAAAVVIGRYAARPLFAGLARTRNEEVFSATALLIVLAAAALTGALGLSLTLGAFLAGMSVSETPYRHVVQSEVKPFRGLLLGFFFITVGMALDWRVLLESWATVLVILAGLVFVKAALGAAAALAFSWSAPGSNQLGFLLAQGSEFAFVILAMPGVRDALGADAASTLIAAVAASIALTPTVAAVGLRFARRLRQVLAHRPDELTRRETAAPVVVFGMDEVGRTVADALEAHGIAYMAVEMNAGRFRAAGADGYPVVYGDLGDPRLMSALDMAEREVVVVTLVRYETSAALTPLMGERYPNLSRFVAVGDPEEKPRFDALGMRAIFDRSTLRGLELAFEVLASRDIERERIDAWMGRQQERALEAAATRATAAEAA